MLAQMQTLLVAKKAQSRPKAEGDLSGELIAELRKKTLSCLIFIVRVDTQNGDCVLSCNLLGFQHQSASYSQPLMSGINGKSMDHYSSLVDVPADLSIVWLLIEGQRSYPGDIAINLCDPQLIQIEVALKDLFVRIVRVPLHISRSTHERNHATDQDHDRRKIFVRCESNTHRFSAYQPGGRRSIVT
jgi:hypothetical protein